jgi:phage tail-like protein
MATRVDPFAKHNFLLEIDGITAAGFTEVGGLTFEQAIIEYREGSDPLWVRKIPGIGKFAPINLKRGQTKDKALFEWRKTTIVGKTERKNGAVILLDEARNPVLRWEFSNGWISKYEGPALNATANEAAIESIEIAVEFVQLV